MVVKKEVLSVQIMILKWIAIEDAENVHEE